MQKFDVQIALEGAREAREKWGDARREFFNNYDKVVTRLLHEAATCYMSDREVAQSLGISVSHVRKWMRKIGMDPKSGKQLLAKHAADALATNSELLGIAPHEMDLMSPLAYLPMGEEMRQRLTDQTVSQVTELPDSEGWDCQSCGASNFIPAGFARVSGNDVICTVPGCNCDIEYRARSRG